MEHLSGKYEKYLSLSGGQIALDKCKWYLLDYKHVQNKIKMITIKNSPDITLVIEETFLKKIVVSKRLNPSEEHRKLGVLVAVNRNKKKEIKFL